MAEKKRQTRERSRAFWSGTLTFGLVSVPVELYAGNRPSPVKLHMLDEDGTPLRRRYVCPEEGRELDADEIVRGYEIEDGSYVVVTDDELEALEPTKSRDIDLRRFVPHDQLDPMFFERAYFLAPGGGSTKAYRLLAETMERAGMAGVATFVMRTREYLVAIIAENGVLRAETLRFADEIRTPDAVGLPARPKRSSRKAAAAIEKEIEKAAADELDEDELADARAARLLELVEEKRRRRVDIVRAEPADPDDEDVIDLMALLKKRLGAAQSKGRKPPRRASSSDDDDDLSARTKDELYARAQELDIPGRSGMTKPQLIRAIRSA